MRDEAAPRGELEQMAFDHFNEPMLCGFELVRCIGYGEYASDCYVIARRPNPRAERIWITCVGGYTFLDRLKNQRHVKAHNGEEWDDLRRLDYYLGLNGVPREAEFIVERRPEESALDAADGCKPDLIEDHVAARIVANFCYLKGWTQGWEAMSGDEQAEIIRMVDSIKRREIIHPV